MMLGRRKLLFIFLFVFMFSCLPLYFLLINLYQIRNFLSYSTRPIWDAPDGPRTVIPHYHAEGLDVDESVCALHGWKPRASGKPLQIFDAVLMSSELDLLEIRMNELDSVVDRFFLIESNTTFTALPKEKFFDKNRERFAKFAEKITYDSIDGLSDPEPFQNEWTTRAAMTQLIGAQVSSSIDTLVIMSDVDEIPAAHTMRLLKACDFGTEVHLQLKSYVYSFEWFLGHQSWRSSVRLWVPGTEYRHSIDKEAVDNIPLLSDAGWHCSFCFRYLEEFVVKMKGFSHNDRIGGKLELLDLDRIQETICRGKDIFGMLPEAYTYTDLLRQLNMTPQTSMVGLPKFLVQNGVRFKFLLAGGCERER